MWIGDSTVVEPFLILLYLTVRSVGTSVLVRPRKSGVSRGKGTRTKRVFGVKVVGDVSGGRRFFKMH